MEIKKLQYYDIYLNKELKFNNLTILETLMQLSLLDSKVDIDLLNKYSVLHLQNSTTTIEVKRK